MNTKTYVRYLCVSNAVFLYVYFSLSFAYSQPVNCTSSSRVCSISLDNSNQDHITIRTYYLQQGVQTKFETSNASPGDTVLLLVRNDTGEVVCENDDLALGNLHSRITTGTSSCMLPSDGFYKIVIRSFDENSGGTTTLEVDGQIVSTDLPFGGRFWNTEWQQNETFQTANVSDHGTPAADTVMIYTVIKSKGIRFDDDSGVSYSPALKTLSTSTSSGWVIVGKYSYATISVLPVRTINVYRNDKSTLGYSYVKPSLCNQVQDFDCDGLGNKLEVELGTCPCIYGFQNQSNVDALCTSLTPGVQNCNYTYNARDTDADGIPDSWEVFGRNYFDPQTQIKYSVELPNLGSNPRHKDVFFELDWVGGQVGSPIISQQTIEESMKMFHVGKYQDLRNPDQENGLHFHLDVSGFSNTSFVLNSKYAGSYGDWGGGSSIPDVGQFYTSAYALKPQYMNPARRGIFYYGVTDQRYPSSFGSPGYMRLKYTSADNSISFTHEAGHMFALTHYGDPNDALKIWCKPNYMSIMNYAYYKEGFSDGSLPTLQFSSLDEQPQLGNNQLQTKWMTWLKNKYFFYIDPVTMQQIDWNRDGSISNSSNLVSYPAAVTRVDGCTSNLFNTEKTQLSNQSGLLVATGFGASLAAFDSKLFMFSPRVVSGDLQLSYRMSIDGKNWLPNSDTSIKIDSTPAAIEFVDATGSKKLVICYRKKNSSSSDIYCMFMQVQGSFYTFSNPNKISQSQAFAVSSNGDYPVRLYVYNNKLMLFYRNTSGQVILRRMDQNYNWDTQETPLIVKKHGQAGFVDLKSKNIPFPVEYLGKLYLFFTTQGVSLSEENRAYWDTQNISVIGKWIVDQAPKLSDYKEDSHIASIRSSTSNVQYVFFYNSANKLSMFFTFPNQREYFTAENPPSASFNREYLLDVTTSGDPSSSYRYVSVAQFNGSIHSVISNTQGSSTYVYHHPYSDLIPSASSVDVNDWDIMSRGVCLGVVLDSAFSAGDICQSQ